ncbi:MAG: hypothetical protein ACLP4V_15570 [Methylocella sp.]
MAGMTKVAREQRFEYEAELRRYDEAVEKLEDAATKRRMTAQARYRALAELGAMNVKRRLFIHRAINIKEPPGIVEAIDRALAEPVTEPVTWRKSGPKPIGDRAMTATERMRRMRARRAQVTA